MRKKSSLTDNLTSHTVDDVEPFIEVEEYKPGKMTDAYFIDPALNKLYRLRWLKKSVLSGNRAGIWHVVDKRHPHFTRDVLHVEVDQTPDKSYYSVGDLVLGVTRRETAENRNQKIQEKTSGRLREIKESYKQEAERALSDAGLETKRSPTFGDIKERRGVQRISASFN